MKPSEQLRELAALLDHRCEGCEDTFSDHVHIPVNCRRCKFESLIPAVERLEHAQRERDAAIRNYALLAKEHIRNSRNVSAEEFIDLVLEKLNGDA